MIPELECIEKSGIVFKKLSGWVASMKECGDILTYLLLKSEIPEEKVIETLSLIDNSIMAVVSYMPEPTKKSLKEGFKRFLEFLSKPEVYRKVLYFWYRMNRLNLRFTHYKKYVLCNSMTQVIPIPILEETYLIMDTDFAISKLSSELEMMDRYTFYRVVPPESTWEEVEVSLVLEEAPDNVLEDIIVNMDFFV